MLGFILYCLQIEWVIILTRQDVLEYLYQYTGKTEKDLSKVTTERNPSLGVSYPKLKDISKLIQKHGSKEFLDSKRIDIYELDIIETYLIGFIKDIDDAIFYFKQAAEHAGEWSVVDSLCQKFMITKKYPKKVLALMNSYAKKNDQYLNRIVAVIVLSHFLIDDMIVDSIRLLSQLKHPEYYTQMAVAWAYATMLVSYPDPVIEILVNQRLPIWTHQKTIQKIIESNRIPQHLKDYIRTLRK